jgi:alkaline phosphatase
MLDQKVNVLLAGGEDDWLPETETGCYPNPGHRTDGRNLITEAIANGYTYVCEAKDLEVLDLENESHFLGLFADDGMLRPYTPTLPMMTTTAIDVLSQDPDGFFLMVEGGQIDWAAHMNDGGDVITDVLGFDSAVARALDYASINPNTLIIVTGDHETGGMSADLVSSGQPDEDGPFLMPDGTPFYINWTTIYHTGVDVPVTAFGPNSEFLIGTYENTHIYEVMRRFLGWQVNLPLIRR